LFTGIYRRYFSTAPSAMASDLRADLWTGAPQPEPGTSAAQETALLLEQYKIYVEMADRVSARRGTTNAFFLTLNTAIFSAIGFVWGRDAHPAASWLLVFPMLVFVGQCLAWFWLVRSYRQLNGAKYAVIGAMEERLPASPYWAAEWKALGEGNDPARYWPLTHLEQWLPLFFAITYLGGFIAIMVA
jgi:hypothetical protein